MGRQSVWLSLALVLIAGCAQLQTKVPEDVEFDLSGRLAARYGKEAFTGNVAWRHAKSADEMLITSSLGAGVARIVRDGDSVVLTTAEPREYRAHDAEALTEEVLGFRLPLSGLADWVRGRPSDPAAARADHDEQGRLRSLEERGWKIDYLEYEGKLPSRMRLTYPDIELRLAISKWQ
jgi:outer membrane lipoprotein LolB